MDLKDFDRASTIVRTHYASAERQGSQLAMTTAEHVREAFVAFFRSDAEDMYRAFVASRGPGPAGRAMLAQPPRFDAVAFRLACSPKPKG
jgi:hypothetical protein